MTVENSCPYIHKRLSCRSYSSGQFLAAHMVTHGAKKPIQCTMCDASFSWRSSLHTHMYTHIGRYTHR